VSDIHTSAQLLLVATDPLGPRLPLLARVDYPALLAALDGSQLLLEATTHRGRRILVEILQVYVRLIGVSNWNAILKFHPGITAH